MTIQTIKLKGDDYVVIPKTEYDALRHEKEDIERFHKIVSLSGQEEALPHDMVKRLLSDNPIKVWREYRGLTTTELAKEVGVSQSYISDIENGKKDGSISVIKRIAEALETDIDLLV